MTSSSISRRTLLQQGSAAVAGLSVLRVAGPTAAFQTPVTGEVIPWLDQPEENPVPEVIVRQLEWEQLDSWITPNDQFFVIKHFNEPQLNENDWRLDISGLVDQPMTLTLDDLKARERQEVTFTLECSGNTGLPFFWGVSVTRRGPARRWARCWKRQGSKRRAARSSSGERMRANKFGGRRPSPSSSPAACPSPMP
jgi:DMSO/TMAO reductase YedYZ molybdopterin-dependent catalytic subunit